MRLLKDNWDLWVLGMNRNAAAISQVVISGHINGVQAIARQEYPFAHFVHCAAHRLNLVLCQSASSISSVKLFFINVGAFSTFTSNAPKRKAFLTSHNIEFRALVILGRFIVPVSLMSFIRIMRKFSIM